MKIALIALAGLATVASAQRSDNWSAAVGRPVHMPYNGGAVSNPFAKDALIYSNGPLGTGPTTLSGVAAPVGFQWSEVANDLPTQSNTSAGFTGSISGAGPFFRIADDFTIPAGETWNIDGFSTFGYNTGTAGTFNPINGGSFNVWDGRPGDVGSNIIATANYGATVNTDMYRIFNTVAPPPGSLQGTTRLIRQVDWTAAISLPAGTYWIDFQYTPTTAGAAIFVPSVTIPGVRTVAGWNGRQMTGVNVWVDALDTGNPAAAPDVAQDFPFLISGTIIPAPASLALIGLGGLVAGRRRR